PHRGRLLLLREMTLPPASPHPAQLYGLEDGLAPKLEIEESTAPSPDVAPVRIDPDSTDEDRPASKEQAEGQHRSMGEHSVKTAGPGICHKKGLRARRQQVDHHHYDRCASQRNGEGQVRLFEHLRQPA